MKESASQYSQIENNPQYPKNVSIGKKLAKNSLFNIGGNLVNFPIYILLVPYMIKVLGMANYGIWAIAGVVTSYARLSDMGMNTGIVKFVAEYWAKREVDKISSIASTAFFSVVFIGGVVTSGILFNRTFIVITLLKIPQEMRSEAIFVISGTVLLFYFNQIFSIYNSILNGIQRMDVTNSITVTSKVLQALGVWIFLAAGMGLKGLIWNSFLFSGLTIIANIAVVTHLIPKFKLSLQKVSWNTFKIIAAFSLNILGAKIIALGQLPINKIILSRYVGITFVSFFDIGERITVLVRQLFILALSPLLPAMSELHGINGTDKIVKMYLILSRILYWVFVPTSVLMISLAEPTIFIWFGEGYIMAARSIQFLTCGFIFCLLVTPEYFILQGIGKPQLIMISHILSATINTFLGIFLAIRFGYYGLLITVVLSYAIAFFYLNWSMRKIFNITTKEYILNIPIVYTILTFFIGFGIYTLRLVVFQWNLSILFLTIFFAIIIHVLMYFFIRNEDDKALFNKFLSTVKNLI